MSEVIGLVGTHQANGCVIAGCRERDGAEPISSISNIFGMNLAEPTNSTGWNWIQFQASIIRWAKQPNSRNPNEFHPILTKQACPYSKGCYIPSFSELFFPFPEKEALYITL
jgi:hypothetical protein